MVWLGQPAVTLGLPATLLSVASVVLVAATVALVTLGSYARHIELHGMVLPAAGLIHVSTPAAGWVESVAVRDGQAVVGGTPLYVINTDTTNTNGNTQQQILRALTAQRSALIDQIARKDKVRGQQDGEIRRKTENLLAQINEMNAQIAMKQEFAQTIEENYADYTRFLQNGVGTLPEKLTQ